MARAPTQQQIKRALKRAEDQASRYNNDAIKTKASPRYIQASNGEGAIVFDVYDRETNNLIETTATLIQEKM